MQSETSATTSFAGNKHRIVVSFNGETGSSGKITYGAGTRAVVSVISSVFSALATFSISTVIGAVFAVAIGYFFRRWFTPDWKSRSQNREMGKDWWVWIPGLILVISALAVFFAQLNQWGITREFAIGWVVIVCISLLMAICLPAYRSGKAAYEERLGRKWDAEHIPLTYGQWLIDRFYKNRFKWSLLLPLILTILMASVAPLVVNYMADLLQGNGGGSATEHTGNSIKGEAIGTFLLAFSGLPLLGYAWFIRAYERERELARNEMELSSQEINRLMDLAAGGSTDPSKLTAMSEVENILVRRAAIRQLQDFLMGTKGPALQRSNSTAILELFSSIVRDHYVRAEKDCTPEVFAQGVIAPHPKLDEILHQPLLLTMSSVMRGVFRRNEDNEPPIKVSADSLNHLHFDLLDLSDVDFSALDLSECTFRYAKLRHCKFDKAILEKTDFTHADLHDADLNNAILDGAKLKNANLEWAMLSNSSLRGTDLESACLIGTKLDKADLSGAKLRQANMSMAVLTEANLIGADLSYAFLIGAQGFDEKIARETPGVILDGVYWETDPQRFSGASQSVI